MADQPPRRWFQFRLSTWFVLVAILALWMTARPAVSLHSFSNSSFSNEDGEEWLNLDLYTRTHKPAILRIRSCWLGIGHNPQLTVALLALLVFVFWKSALAIKGRIARYCVQGTTFVGEPSPRRWFQFRLSTWFVLTAILCIWLASKPSHSYRFRDVHLNGNVDKPEEVVFGISVLAYDPLKYRNASMSVGFERNSNRQSLTVALLVLLIAWIVGARVVRRHKARAAE